MSDLWNAVVGLPWWHILDDWFLVVTVVAVVCAVVALGEVMGHRPNRHSEEAARRLRARR